MIINRAMHLKQTIALCKAAFSFINDIESLMHPQLSTDTIYNNQTF